MLCRFSCEIEVILVQKFCCDFHLTFSKTRCGCVAFYFECMSPVGILWQWMMKLIVVSSVSLFRDMFLRLVPPAVPVFVFLSCSPSPFGSVGSLWGGGCSRQGTSGVHSRVSCGDMDLGM